MKIPTRLLSQTLFVIALSAYCSTTVNAQISGHVFRDFNGDGIRQTNEPLVNGIVVRAYLANGTLCGSTVSTGIASPNYSLNGCGTDSVRLEFVIPEDGVVCGLSNLVDFSSTSGTSYGSSVQFVQGNSTGVHFAINAPEDYFTFNQNPQVYVPCYVNGEPSAPAISNTDAIVSVNFDATGPINKLATTGQVGTVWGVAYSRQCKKLFFSAMLKRHAGMGPLGSGGIYLIDPVTNTLTNWLDLDAIGIPTRGSGAYTGPGPLGPNVPYSPVIGTNAERNLGLLPDAPSYDAPALAQVGRVSLGDMDLSDDGRYLFVMNLYDKKVYRIDLVDPSNPQAPDATNVGQRVQSWEVPSPGCTNGTHRPFAVEFARGKLFVGLVCSGENGGTNADISAYVYEVTDFTNGTYSTLFSFPLNYTKGWAFSFFGNSTTAQQYSGWFPWTDDAALMRGAFFYVYPQPILCDLVFDADGSIIMAFLDRTGHQVGWYNYDPDGTTLRLAVIGGDLLRAYFNPATCSYELESNGKEGPSSPKPATLGAGNNEGPGGGEFYYRDCFDCTPGGFHREIVQGGIASAPGSGEIATAVIDPKRYDSGGLTWFSNTTGADVKDYELFFSGGGGPSPSGTFSKAAGLGDVGVSLEAAPIEIGNRVWLDLDGDGIQDANEPGIPNVTVQLLQSNTVIATATTDTRGHYFFSSSPGTNTSSAIFNLSNLLPGMAFSVRVPNVDGADKQGALGDNILTTANADDGLGDARANLRDSDGILTGSDALAAVSPAEIPVSGANNHSFDFGFSPLPSCTIAQSNLTTICDDNGTGATADDVFTITANPSGTGIGTAYNVSVLHNGSTTSYGPFAYGAPSTLPATFLISGGNASVTITDASSTGCSLAATANAPAPCGYVTVGDYTWIDLNRDGLQNDPYPLQGVKATIYDVATGNPVLLDVYGNPYTPNQVTNASGNYLFTFLPAGNYYVVFDRGMIANADLYTFTTPSVNGGVFNTIDSDAQPTTGTLGVTRQTGFLAAGEADLDLDAGVQCNLAVELELETTVCTTKPVRLNRPTVTIQPTGIGGVWSTSGDGTFVGGTAFGSAVSYLVGPGDIANGSVTLTLTTNPPANLDPPSSCPSASASKTIEILRVNCGQFPWSGN